MTAACTTQRVALGAYVLGALDPSERAELEGHLAECPRCREELAEFAGLPGLLGLLTAADLAAPGETTAPDLLTRTLNELGRRRRIHRHRLLAAAAAVLIAVTAGGVVLATTDLARPSEITATVTNPATHVTATATLRDQSSGTAITLRLRGVPAGEHCRLVAVSGAGRHQTTASWQANYSGTAEIHTTSTIHPTQLASLLVVAADGTRLATLLVR